MKNEMTILGISFILIGIIIDFFVKSIFPGLILMIIGVFLILFNNKESQIEQRKDIKNTNPIK